MHSIKLGEFMQRIKKYIAILPGSERNIYRF